MSAKGPFNPTSAGADQVAAELLARHNVARTKQRKAALAMDVRLTRAAQKHAMWMATNETLSHTGDDGTTPLQRTENEGYFGRSVGENVTRGNELVIDVMKKWLGTASFSRNVLNSVFVKVGFGYARGRKFRYYCAVYASAHGARHIEIQRTLTVSGGHFSD